MAEEGYLLWRWVSAVLKAGSRDVQLPGQQRERAAGGTILSLLKAVKCLAKVEL